MLSTNTAILSLVELVLVELVLVELVKILVFVILD